MEEAAKQIQTRGTGKRAYASRVILPAADTGGASLGLLFLSLVSEGEVRLRPIHIAVHDSACSPSASLETDILIRIQASTAQ